MNRATTTAPNDNTGGIQRGTTYQALFYLDPVSEAEFGREG